MIRCQVCATDNLDGCEYCDECGTKLLSASVPLPPPQSSLPKPSLPQLPPPITHSFPIDSGPLDATWPPQAGSRGVDQGGSFSTIFRQENTYAPPPTEPDASPTFVSPESGKENAPPDLPPQKQTSALPSKFCTACGAWNPNTSRDCQSCGQPMAVFCQNCGSRNLPSSQHCQTCGLKFDPIKENAVSATVVGSRLVHHLRQLFNANWRSKPVVPESLHRFPFIRERAGNEARVALVESFRFVHEPINEASASRFVGRQNELESLAERILFSEGGSFLVTGYRGVGKTSFINQVVKKLDEATPWAGAFLGQIEVVDIYLNIARPVQPGELMHYIIRQLYDRLVEKQIYSQLDKDLQEALNLAYQRTSVNMARKLAEASERNFGFNEASIGGDWLKAAVKASWSTKRSRTQNYEMTFLGYDDKTAEHDIITLSRRLSAGYVKPMTRLQRLRQRVTGELPTPVRLKIVFVFDELDKLEEFTAKDDAAKDGAEKKPVIDQILGALKNLFTTSGVTFVFVAGKDLQERWLDDVGKGDSVYESVFSYDKYLPCMWADVDGVCDGLVDWRKSVSPYEKQVFTDFKKFLAYKGRGIPRRIIRTFNEYVEWGGDYPALTFIRQSLRRIRFFAGLQDALSANERLLFGETHEESPGTQSDKRRLGVYYLIDWMLRQGTSEFALKDVLNASRRLSVKIALAEEIAPGVIEEVIRILIEYDYLQTIQKGLDKVVIGDAAAADEEKYRVVLRRLVEMGGLGEESAEDARLFADTDKVIKRIGRYRVMELIGTGGMGKVYKATDDVIGRIAAIKVLSEEMNRQEEFVRRFEREAKVMSALHHPNVVQFYDWGNEAGRFFIAMEYLDGLTLDSVNERLGKLSLQFVVPIVKAVADAAHYVHQQGFVRNDIKPHNIMLTAVGRVCLLDFGITKSLKESSEPDFGAITKVGASVETPTFSANKVVGIGKTTITKAGGFVGTPLFSAPEQLDRGEADARADIYSLGVVLYRMLTGVHPFGGDGMAEIMRAHLFKNPEPPSYYALIPEAVDRVVLKCLQKDPNQRYQTMQEMAEALVEAAGNLPPADLSSLVTAIRAEAEHIEAVNQVNTLETPVDSLFDVAISDVFTVTQAPAPNMESPRVDATEAPAKSYGQEAPAPMAPPASPPGDELLPPIPIPTVPLAPPSPQPLGTPSFAVGEFTGEPCLILLADAVERGNSVGTAEVREFKLKPETRIGRSLENDVVLSDAKVSRHHALVYQQGEEWFVRDLNSYRGVYVNEERVIESASLKDGDLIRLGGSIFQFKTAETRTK